MNLNNSFRIARSPILCSLSETRLCWVIFLAKENLGRVLQASDPWKQLTFDELGESFFVKNFNLFLLLKKTFYLKQLQVEFLEMQLKKSFQHLEAVKSEKYLNSIDLRRKKTLEALQNEKSFTRLKILF